MPIKTKEGWKTKGQVRRQEQAWRKSRENLMMKVGKDILSDAEKVKERANEIFAEIDTDGNLQIDATELKAGMAKLGIALTGKEVKAMMEEADQDGDNQLDKDEFSNLVQVEAENFMRVQKSKACVVM